MSRLPEKGDAQRAMAAFTARAHAVGAPDGSEAFDLGDGEVHLNLRTGRMGGDVHPMLRVYGDLFDVGEFLSDGGLGLVIGFVTDIGRDKRDPLQTMLSLAMQCVATGVLMERQRWEKP